MVSALKKDGRRLYALAREGVEVDREPRTVLIRELEILGVGAGDHPTVSFRVVCGKGTYVRSLADDMARALGGFAHLTALRRTRTGVLTVEEAVAIEDLDRWREHLLDPSYVLAHMPAMTVDEERARLVANGQALPTTPGLTGPIRVLDETGRLLAVYESDSRSARPAVVIA
jgi:tRNA pseudouridine55 synthase